jgi:hypothetical protein
MDKYTLEAAQQSILVCINDFQRCVRIGSDGTFKPEGESKMGLTEFIAWVGRNR